MPEQADLAGGEENGFHDLLAAASRLVNLDFLQRADWEDARTEDLRAFVDANAATVSAAREVLREPCRVPTAWNENYFQRHMADVPRLRNLVRALTVKARLAWRQGDHAAALDSVVDMLRLAVACRNGGLISDVLISIAFESMGLRLLRMWRGGLRNDLRLAAAGQLIEIDSSRESFAAIDERDAEWERAGYGNGEASQDAGDRDLPDLADGTDGVDPEFVNVVRQWMEAYAGQPRHIHRWDQRCLDDRNRACLRMLAVDLALRAYRAAHGCYPEHLDVLTPELLATRPLDPFSATEFIYRRDAESFQLYSVGVSGKDGGGCFGSWLDVYCRGADLGLDMEG